MVTDLRDRLYRNVHDGRVPFSGLVIREGVVEIRIAGAGDRDRVLTRLTAPSENPSVRGNPLDVVDKGDGVIRLTPTDAAFAANLAMLVGRAMGVIDQRLDDSGIKGAGVLPDGDDRIRLALPGIREPERVAALFVKKVPVSFRLIDVSMSPEAASTTTPPPGSEILYGLKDKTPYLVLKDSVLDGDDLDDVAPGFGPDNKEPIVSFRFNARGQRRFAHVTEENIGKPFAIALGDKVISAPVIREPITGGQGQISGNFTLQEANSVAMTMLAAALPGRLTLVAQQVIEPAGR
jgi:preprotein translocase subunit SecD